MTSTEQKTFFNEDWRYLSEALELHNEVTVCLEPIMNKYVELGYSPREISYLMDQAVNDLAMMHIINKGIK